MMLKMVRIERINFTDRTFQFRLSGLPERIKKAIEKNMMPPALVQDLQESCRIIAGFDILAAASSENRTEVPAYVLPDYLDQKTLCRKALIYSHSLHEFRDAETAYVLFKLKDVFSWSIPDITRELGELTPFSGNREYLRQMQKIGSFPLALLKKTVTGECSFKRIKLLLELPKHSRADFFRISTDKLGLTWSEFKTALRYVSEMPEMKTEGFGGLMKSEPFPEILHDEKRDRKTKNRDFIKALHALRYPVASEFLKKMERSAGRIRTPDRVSLVLPHNFERNELTLTARISQSEDFEKLREWFQNQENFTQISRLLKYLNFPDDSDY